MELLDFAAVPTRARHDGWSPADQREFVAAWRAAIWSMKRRKRSATADRALMPSAASPAPRSSRALGKARWRSGARCGKPRALQPGPQLTDGFETLLVPRFYRGRLVGFVQRMDNAAALRALAELDGGADGRMLSKLTR